VLALVFLLWGIAFFYNMKLKEYGFFGNLIVATSLGMIFIVGGILAGAINGVVLTFAALAFFFDLGEEIAADAMDVKGDQVRSSESLAKRWNRTRAMRMSRLMFLVFFLLTPIPFLAGWLARVWLPVSYHDHGPLDDLLFPCPYEKPDNSRRPAPDPTAIPRVGNICHCLCPYTGPINEGLNERIMDLGF